MSLLPDYTHDPNVWARTERHEGTTVERRQCLRLSLAIISTLLANVSVGVAARPANERPTGWDNLIERARQKANRLTESPSPDEDFYLRELSAAIMRQARNVPSAHFDLTAPVAAHESLRQFPLWVLQFRLAPRAEIPYHDHRDYIGVLTVTEGAVRVRSFQILGSDQRPPKGEIFQIRETENSLLTKGAQSTVSRACSNIHQIKAGPAGARFIDFFTLFNEGAHSAYLNVAEQPTHLEKRVFDASWV